MYKLMQYENWWGHRKRLLWIAEHIQDNMECIDVGCGTGAYLTIPLNLIMEEKGYVSKIYGMDLVPESIKKAKENARITKIPSEYFLCGDITKHKKKYDIVICSEVLEHINSEFLEQFANGLCTCVSDNGILIITVPNGQGSFEKGKKMRKSIIGRTIFPRIEKLFWLIDFSVFRQHMYFDEVNLKTPEERVLMEMTVSMTEHLQFFSKNDIIALFKKIGMELIEFTGSSRFSGACICLLPPFQWLTKINNYLGKIRPQKASAYYFVFRKSEGGA